METDEQITPGAGSGTELAHVRQDEDGHWQVHGLEEHLRAVAELAGRFAAPFGGEWAYLAGLWHDLGKYQPAFQRYIGHASGFQPDAHIEGAGRVNHSTAGAIHAEARFGPLGHVLSYLIAGHHAGLPDWDGLESEARGALSYRLREARAEYEAAMAKAPPAVLAGAVPREGNPGRGEGFHLWLRMLFSALVDADFLDTEKFMDAGRADTRGGWPTLGALRERLDGHLSTFRADTEVNRIRAEVLANCRAAAALPPGLFSLTVPTGGGKTLSSLAFALDHALAHGRRRVIYAIPYTSIIEQTADVFRGALGQEAVLEHHSSLDPARETLRTRLSAENWDAPLTVTTNVQLFESLFAAKPSRCRKLHNLVDSVIVLDEAQQLPREFLAPITGVMRLLSEHYGVTWLLCTATQPNLEGRRDGFGRTLFKGLPAVHEIIPDPQALADRLKRVSVKLPARDGARMSWSALAQDLAAEDCVLAIVNTRGDCRTLYQSLPADGSSLHLSALMCPQHRSDVLDGIRDRLRARRNGDDRPLRVVSTQLVEAGVDVDFPVVYRALAGLDSIAQAAGRCNREGRLLRPGRVVVFQPESDPPPGLLRQGASVTRELLEEISNDPLSPAGFARYFRLLYSKSSSDANDIEGLLKPPGKGEAPLAVQFRSAAARFRLIPDEQEVVICPYRRPDEEESPVKAWLRQLDADGSQRWLYRKLQRYTVSLSTSLFQQLLASGGLVPAGGQYLLLGSLYDAELGVTPPGEAISTESLIC